MPLIFGGTSATFGGNSGFILAAGQFIVPDGTAAAPTYSFTAEPTMGMYRSATNNLGFAVASALWARLDSAGNWVNGGSLFVGAGSGLGSLDSVITRTTTNALRFAASTATTTSRTELNKAVTTISNAVATTVLTVTIPNAAHSGSLRVRVTGSLGAGGAIGANEATAVNEYIVVITRTAGVATVPTISSAYGAAASAVAGAATVTCTAALSAVSGAVGATQTFDVQVTISRSGGSSDNHTCNVYAQLCNANATGITIA